ncbi:MAG: type II secretion system protein [Eubacterium sp.]|nr:type II secretion system protein [Eubacterium sp.]
MAKKKNLGFSLIEVVIAVAVLGLLITPILTQIVHTSNTSRKAKERQAAVENAEYITNFIQRTDKSELDKSSSDGVSDINITAKTHYDNVVCTLVDTDGVAIKTVKYNATVYKLDNVKLGPKSNEYERQAVLDDLNNNVLAAGYSILYDSSEYSDELKSGGYQLTNEGSIVKHYAADSSYPGLVKEIVCEARPDEYTTNDIYEYKNPNAVSLGFIQDLDSSKVAIIQGIASNFDAQVSDELFSQKMNRLQMVDEDGWKDQLGAEHNVFENDTSSVRLLYVSITAHKDGEDIDYYEVTCDACYYDKTTVASQSLEIKLKYNVFAKKFYTTKSPDIYLIYEPYVSDTAQQLYSFNDFIEIYNDEDTCDSKLYLIKPSKNQLSLSTNSTEYVEGGKFATLDNATIKPVNININAVLANGETVSTKNIIKTYTNIDIDYTQSGWTQFSVDSTVRGTAPDPTGLTTLKSMALPSSDYSVVDYPNDYDPSNNIDNRHLLKLEDDTNPADRLFTITVVLEPVDGSMDDVRYSAGKGVD